MCYQVHELYSSCRCLYYQHAIDRCPRFGAPGHGVTQRTILVGYACVDHSSHSKDLSSSHSGGYSADDEVDKSSHVAIRSGRSSKPRRASQNLATPTSLKPRSNKSKNDQIPQLNPNIPGPRQKFAKKIPLPDVKQEPTRGQEGKAILEGGKSQVIAPTGRLPEEQIAAPDLHSPDCNSIDCKDNDSTFDVSDSDESYSNESTVSDTGTIISVASSTTTVNSDATEAIFRRLLLFQDLRYLWPQLALRYASKSMIVLTIERLLRRYAEDLSKLAASTETLKDSDSLICLTASRFVRRSRLNIAQRICEAHYNEKDDYTETDDDIRERMENTTAETTGDSHDMNFIYETSERFLFETEPILALQSSVKALVGSQDPLVDGLGSRLYRTAEIYFSNVVSFIYEPPLKLGTQRVRWKCVSLLRGLL